MNLEEMKELMTIMEERGIKKVALKQESGFELELERESDFYFEPSMKIQKKEELSSPSRKEGILKEGRAEEDRAEEGVSYVSSPMVGTFYSSPTPDEAPFVKVGDTVEEDTVVCIIEAMKVMNEVKAGKKGKIMAMLTENSHPVDFGTKLFQIKES